MEFSKNGVFHGKGVVMIFSNDQIQIPTLPLGECGEAKVLNELLKIVTLHHFTILLRKIYPNRVNQTQKKPNM